MARLTRAKPLLVILEDAYGDSEWADLTTKPLDRAICFSLGWVFSEDDDVLELRATSGTWHSQPLRVVDGANRVVIPKKWILARRRVEITEAMLKYRGKKKVS